MADWKIKTSSDVDDYFEYNDSKEGEINGKPLLLPIIVIINCLLHFVVLLSADLFMFEY
jgi:hypothetical protein